MKKADLDRPWRVVINADVSTTQDYDFCPALCKGDGMDEAVRLALDTFRMEHERDNIKIHKVWVERNDSAS